MENITRPYLIGETAYIHEGDLRYLMRMVNDIAEAGLNAVKFHILLDQDSYITRDHPLARILERWLFSEKEWDTIIDCANDKGLDVIALCDDVKSIKYIMGKRKNITAIEIHATGLNDYYLLEAASRFYGTIILAVGGSTEEEISCAVAMLHKRGRKNIVLMHGFQSYPTDYRKINLRRMPYLSKAFSLPIGYADHTAFDDPHNEFVSVMGAVMGFHILEKHYALCPGEKRIDYEAAVGLKSLAKIRELMRIALDVYGTSDFAMSSEEEKYGRIGPMKKAVVARHDIEKGEKFSVANLWFKRTKYESLMRQTQFPNLLGTRATKSIKKNEVIVPNKPGKNKK